MSWNDKHLLENLGPALILDGRDNEDDVTKTNMEDDLSGTMSSQGGVIGKDAS